MHYKNRKFKIKYILFIYAFLSSFSFDRYIQFINNNKYLYEGKNSDLKKIYNQAQMQLFLEKNIVFEPVMFRSENLLIDIFFNNFKTKWYPKNKVTKEQFNAMLLLICFDFENDSIDFEFIETPFIKYKGNIYFFPNVVGNISLQEKLDAYFFT